MIAIIKRVFARFSIVALLALALLSVADHAMATDISGNLTADNGFYAYISTSPSALGTLVASGSDWQTTYSFSGAALTPGVTNYLQIEAINWGEWGGLLGQFTLSDTDFQSANGSQSLLTDTTDWVGIYNDSNSSHLAPQPWVTPTGGVVSFGANGVPPWWTRPGIDSGALWIWPTNADTDPSFGACQTRTVDLMTAIYPTTTPVPEPGTLMLFGSGIVALLGAVRRKLG